MNVRCPMCNRSLGTRLNERPLQGDSLVLLLELDDAAIAHLRSHFDGTDGGEPLPVDEVA